MLPVSTARLHSLRTPPPQPICHARHRAHCRRTCCRHTCCWNMYHICRGLRTSVARARLAAHAAVPMHRRSWWPRSHWRGRRRQTYHQSRASSTQFLPSWPWTWTLPASPQTPRCAQQSRQAPKQGQPQMKGTRKPQGTKMRCTRLSSQPRGCQVPACRAAPTCLLWHTDKSRHRLSSWR